MSKPKPAAHNELQVTMVPIDSLIPYARNARTHSEEQVAQIAGSIKEFGFNDPIAIDGEGVIIEGHGRVMAARKLGLQTVPVIRLEHMSDSQKRAYILAHNKIALNAGWDEDMLKAELGALAAESFELTLAGFDEKEISQALSGDPSDADAEPQVDKAEELRDKWGVETGQLWKLGEHRLMCGDSTDPTVVKRAMGGEQADCVFTSPPYAVGIDYGETYRDTIESLRGMLPKLAELWAGIVQPGGFAVVNFGDIISGRSVVGTEEPCEYPMSIEYWPVFKAAGWNLWSRRIWCKPIARVSAPWCASSNRSATNFEHVWTWKLRGPAIVGRVAGPMDSQTGWFDTTKLSGVAVGKDDHGAGMPTGCAQWMIGVHSRASGIVHEPFSGTGTTLIACEQLGRKCRAIEISPGYVAVAIQRWADATGKKPELINGK